MGYPILVDPCEKSTNVKGGALQPRGSLLLHCYSDPSQSSLAYQRLTCLEYCMDNNSYPDRWVGLLPVMSHWKHDAHIQGRTD